MSNIFPHYGGSYTSGPAKSFVPLFYVGVIILDIVLLLLVKVLFFYTITPPVDGAALAKADPAYENVEILDEAEMEHVKILLVRTQAGEELLLPLERLHGFQRYHLVKGSVTAPAATGATMLKLYSGEAAVTLDGGLTLVGVGDDSYLQKDGLIIVGIIAVEFLVGYIIYDLKDRKKGKPQNAENA